MEIDNIITIIFAGLSVLFAGLSFRYSKLAYTKNHFSGKVLMNYAFANFGEKGIIDIITFSFTNNGHRNGIIRNVYLEANNKKTIWFAMMNSNFFVEGFGLPSFPYELGEMGELSFSIFKDDFEKIIKESTENGKKGRLKYLCFSDNAGNIYKYKIKKSNWKFLFS